MLSMRGKMKSALVAPPSSDPWQTEGTFAGLFLGTRAWLGAEGTPGCGV